MKPTSQPSLCVVIPAFNEGRSVGNVVGKVKEVYPHVVVVDDGSNDDTALQSRAAGAVVLSHILNRGQGAALKTGIDYALGAGAQIVVTFDSDGQHQVEDIAPMIAPILGGAADVALGSRFRSPESNVPPLRKFILKCGIVFTRLVSRIHVTDTHNGLRAFSRDAASRIEIRQDRMAHASEILDEIGRLKLRYCEVPVRVVYSDYAVKKGQRSSAAFRIIWDFLIGKWER
ncbi:MAG: glycosyltransferase family 2 protein [Verrucomicrobiia bacterium]